MITSDIYGPTGYVTSYVGPGAENATVGAISDGGRDAFDGWGFYKATGGFALSRQTEAFTDQNLFRFFDTFTNTGAETVTQTVTFFGNLGSDSYTYTEARGPGYLVTCQRLNGVCVGDPVVGAVHGGNGLGVQTLAGEEYRVNYTLTLAPGQSASLLNYAVLASTLVGGTTRDDVVIAAERAFALTSDPFLDGLTAAQRRRVVNFDLDVPQGVPEPATWAMMLAGFGLIGAAVRRRRARPLAFGQA
ncbi:PEPxxWA-CTERM sorting domain-containing protein [Phenylobacterium sp.]|uniref:PEPxxWA-CTERM sorting domain-containing protein n=1 Tax=Phenylobacterium sp. TaxID=1871053 RepID=UPI0025DCD2A9|nr:PEPxxWA-CTERM sorting domain-containing protein [Phenylobacterium sp.]